MIVMGAATHGLKLQAFKPTIPIKVAMEAPCTVILVKQELPFAQLSEVGSLRRFDAANGEQSEKSENVSQQGRMRPAAGWPVARRSLRDTSSAPKATAKSDAEVVPQTTATAGSGLDRRLRTGGTGVAGRGTAGSQHATARAPDPTAMARRYCEAMVNASPNIRMAWVCSGSRGRRRSSRKWRLDQPCWRRAFVDRR